MRARSYNGNPLVNAMCVGLARTEHLLRAIAIGIDNPIILVGADTGRDGIGGANVLASRTFEAGQEDARPTVQVGNPFLEKLLMEACVQLAEEHADWIVGLQDCGAAGLTSSLVECAARGGAGIEIDVAPGARRESGMTAAEVMLSESQERMLVIAKKEHEQDVIDFFHHWETHADVIGKVTDDGVVRIFDGDEVQVRVPAKAVHGSRRSTAAKVCSCRAWMSCRPTTSPSSRTSLASHPLRPTPVPPCCSS